MTHSRGGSRLTAVQTTRPARPAAMKSSVTFSPAASEWSIAPVTDFDAGCHFGQLPGVVTYVKTVSGCRAMIISFLIRVLS
jgi:hypothetical protein